MRPSSGGLTTPRPPARLVVASHRGASMTVKAPSETDRAIGRRIRLRRLACRMSQEQFAAALGVTFQQVQKYERGANRISAGRLQAVARVLRVPVAAFYEAPPEAEAALWVDPEALRLAEAFGVI